jgi:para-nitrobenzyl esterase
MDSVEDGDVSSDRVIDELMALDGISRDGMKDRMVARYLRSKTAEEILSVYYSTLGFGMLESYGDVDGDGVVEFRQVFRDGTVIHADPELALFTGDYSKVPLILGTNDEEDKLFLSGLYSGYTSTPCCPTPPCCFTPPCCPCDYQDTAEFLTATSWDPRVDYIAPLLSLHQPGDVYAYRFLYGTYRHLGRSNDCEPDPGAFNAWADLRLYGLPNMGLMLGACHALDIPFFFANFEFFGFEDAIFHAGNYLGFTSLSDAMIAYVAQFARTGDPGDAGGVAWTPWANTPTGPRILLDADWTNNLSVMSTP